MNKCPQCGQVRQAEEYRCLSCGCFYSQLDEILAEEQAIKERNSLKGRANVIMQADDSWQALQAELKAIKENTPRRTIFTLWVIFAFVFALIVTVL